MASVEGDGKETVGKGPVIRKSEVFQGGTTIHTQRQRGAFFSGDAVASSGRFAVYSSITFSPKAGRDCVTHEEVGLYTVKADQIAREEFSMSHLLSNGARSGAIECRKSKGGVL